uniref:Uncharacterized protein n=1 Tax=Pararge aegeria TaxID=116150 RepID=S4PP06_9NEOP
MLIRRGRLVLAFKPFQDCLLFLITYQNGLIYLRITVMLLNDIKTTNKKKYTHVPLKVYFYCIYIGVLEN